MLLQKRSNGVYYFRWVYPSSLKKLLGKRELIISLRTTCRYQAHARAGMYYDRVESLKKLAETTVRRNHMSSSSPTEQNLIAEYEATIPTVLEALLTSARLYRPVSLREAVWESRAVDKLLSDFQLATTNIMGEYEEGRSVYRDTQSLLMRWSKVVPPDEDIFQRIPKCKETVGLVMALYAFKALGDYSVRFADSLVLTNRLIVDVTRAYKSWAEVRSQHLPSSDRGTLIREPANVGLPIAKSYPVIDRSPPSSIRLSDLIAKFMQRKQSEGLSERIAKEYQGYIPFILHFIGDIPITEIQKKHIKSCLQQAHRLPKRNKGAYKRMSVTEMVAMDVPAEDRIQPATVEQIRKLLQGVFRFAIDQDYLEVSPAVDLNLPSVERQSRGAFELSEASALIRQAMLESEPWKKWVILLAAYTGARAGEIVQIRKEDLKSDPESGLPYILITPRAGSVKTKNAFRTIPIHPKLFEFGLSSFTDSSHVQGRLFPNIVAQNVTKWFPGFREKLGINKLNEYDEPRTFHSLRHTFVTILRGSGATDVQVQQIVGHEKTSAGVTDRYTKRFTVTQLTPIVELIDYYL